MEYIQKVSIFTISSVHYLALMILIAFNAYIFFRTHKNVLFQSFLIVQIAFLIWIVSKIFKTVSPTFELRWFFVVSQYFGICLLEVAMLNFSVAYTKARLLSKRTLSVFVPVAIVQFLVIATNEYHHLFYSRFEFSGDDFGPLFYVHMLIMYSCILYSIITIGRHFTRSNRSARKFFLISSAIIFPLLANIFYLSGYYHKLMHFLHWRSFDITPIAFEISLGIFAYAIYKKHFLDLMPIFEDDIIRHSLMGIIVLDENNQILQENEAAKTLKFNHPDVYKNKVFDENCCEQLNYIRVDDSLIYQRECRKIVNEKGRMKGHIILLTDVTHEMQVKNDLEQANEEIIQINKSLEEKIKLQREISAVAQRNYVARELHDILGHSMTITIKLLEIALLETNDYFKIVEGTTNETEGDISSEKTFILRDYEHIEKTIKQAKEICRKGYSDLRVSLIEEEELICDFIGLKHELDKIKKVLNVAGVELSYVSESLNTLFTNNEYITLKRFCQESITNAVKHGKATSIRIDFNFEDGDKSIVITNNGKLPEKIVKGNGISGLETRIEELNACLSYELNQEEGFKVSLIY